MLDRAHGGIVALGFHAALFLTGHYGPNWRDLKTLLDLLQPHVATRLYGLPDFEANLPGFDGDGKATGDHAGKVETSLLWALEPDSPDHRSDAMVYYRWG
jgi:creatinine amidohydrolase